MKKIETQIHVADNQTNMWNIEIYIVYRWWNNRFIVIFDRFSGNIFELNQSFWVEAASYHISR